MKGRNCACRTPHTAQRLVLTGGPGAGKTAVLELVRKTLCRHVRVLPEAASILFGGGFPREPSPQSRKAAQRAIYHVQRELEELSASPGTSALTLCDRGTLDGVAYWPGPPEELFRDVGTTIERELARYQAVIHMRTPSVALGYNYANVLRTEPAALAAEIDGRIASAWSGHPRRFVVESRTDFLIKADEVLRILRAHLPACCSAPRPDEHEGDAGRDVGGA